VGFWKVKLISEGNVGIPDGTVIDNGFAEWHSDGTEILNSSRVPATGSFCMAVWQKTGKMTFDLNHFALAWNADGTFVGPGQMRQEVTVNKAADQYSGTFTIDQFDSAGNPLAYLDGKVIATRITVDTSIGDVL
jgi:hypothetical protein